MNAKKWLLTSCLLIAGTGTAFAGAHNLTYTKKSAAPGTVLTMANGDEYVMIRVPFATFDGQRYSIILPVASDYAFLYLVTSHDTKAFASNITVDSYPARISVEDGRAYNVIGPVGTAATFSVQAAATATLQIKIGSTIVTVSGTVTHRNSVTGEDEETHVDGIPGFDFRPYADWAQYKDPKTEVKVLNDLIDYIRIIAPAP